MKFCELMVVRIKKDSPVHPGEVGTIVELFSDVATVELSEDSSTESISDWLPEIPLEHLEPAPDVK